MVMEKSGKNLFFFKVREKSGNFALSQGNSKFLVKVSEKSVNFIFRLPQALIMNFIWTKGNVFQSISINQCEEKRIDNLQKKLKQM